MKIGINGFGRVGRQIFRQAFEKGIEIVCVNDPFLNIEQKRILLHYDSIYSKFNFPVEVEDNNLLVNKQKIACFSEHDLDLVNLTGIDFLIDSSGRIKNKKAYMNLISKNPNIKKILITTYSKEVDQTIVHGVNEDELKINNGKIISTATCDAVAILPIIKKALSKEIESVSIISLHPYLSNQKLLDGCGINIKDISLIAEWRAAPDSLIPKETSVEPICMNAFPELKGKVKAYQLRIPTSSVSCAFIDITFINKISKEWLNSMIKELEEYYLINSDFLTSKDFQNDRHSGVIDLRRLVIQNNTVRMLVWYDNEAGYSAKALDVLRLLNGKGD